MKWSIDWNDRMLSATCFDPEGDYWQGDWKMSDQNGNGYCTPAGISCFDGATTADLCPLNYGGSGDGCQPPNLITTLINIALAPGVVDEPMYAGQPGIQNILLLLALASVPVLLLAKPYILKKQHESSHNEHVVETHDSDEE